MAKIQFFYSFHYGKMTLGELAKCAILGFWMGTHLYLQMIGKRLSVRGGFRQKNGYIMKFVHYINSPLLWKDSTNTAFAILACIETFLAVSAVPSSWRGVRRWSVC